jgi:hypothetical protein
MDSLLHDHALDAAPGRIGRVAATDADEPRACGGREGDHHQCAEEAHADVERRV